MTQIAFTGDIAFTKHFSESCGDENLLSQKIVDFLASSDHTVVNIEGAVSCGTHRTDKPLTHANPLECVNWMKKINGKIWALANNHVMDCGADGLHSTLEAAENNQFSTIGAGTNRDCAQKPLIIDKEGGIGIIAVTYYRQNRAGTDTPGCFIAEDEADVKRQIEALKEKNRWCIVVSHVGQEFSQLPMPFLRERYKRYFRYGADIVIGHHSHVVQNFERFGSKIVFYSLGNFIFDTNYQRIQAYTDYGMLVKLNFTENAFTWEYLPIKNNRETMQITEAEKPAIFRNISAPEYRLLWPLAASYLSKNEWKKNTFHHPEYAERSWLDWLLKFDLKKCDAPQGRNILFGRFLKMFGLWRLGTKETVTYIQEKWYAESK